MCNLYTYKLSRDEIRGLMEHYKLVGLRGGSAPLLSANRCAAFVAVAGGQSGRACGDHTGGSKIQYRAT